jgi:Xaa-Pro aminopeptidase
MGAPGTKPEDLNDPLVQRAATIGNRNVMGPGEPAVSEWAAVGLELPDLDAMQRYRLARIQERLAVEDVAGVLLFDPLNQMYATNSPNMQMWFTHNHARWAFVATNGPLILFDYQACEFLSAHNPLIDEVRPTTTFTYFPAGTRVDERAARFAAEIADLARTHGGDNNRLAVDVIPPAGSSALVAEGLVLTDGMAVMERARAIKGPDEIAAMRCSVEATRISCLRMFEAMEPGTLGRALGGDADSGRRVDGVPPARVGATNQPMVPGVQQPRDRERRLRGLRHRSGRRLRDDDRHIAYLDLW